MKDFWAGVKYALPTKFEAGEFLTRLFLVAFVIVWSIIFFAFVFSKGIFS